jgi:GTP-binding protein HflX
MSRLGGGIGTRGPGETKLEVDRQHIRRRLAKLRRDITSLGRTRRVKRAGRERSGIPQVALVGYTNAGKSTLMNALTGASTLVADQPFATLDPTTRRLRLPAGRTVTLSDTVGFVRKLPHDLVEAFKSTLEEVTRGDLLLHVADASAPELESQVRAVREVLADIGAGHLPEVLVLNKWDRLEEMDRARAQKRFPEGVPASALRRHGLDEVRTRIQESIPTPAVEVTLLVPFDRPEVVPWLHRTADVIRADAGERGTTVVARVTEEQLARVGSFVVQPVARRVGS